MRRLTAGAAAVLGAVALLAAPASAAVRTKTVPVPKVGVVSVQAKCPKGQRATGGGWEASPSNAGDLQVRPQESRKIGQRSWRVTVSQDSPGNPSAKATAVVNCSKDAPKTTQRSRAVTYDGVDFAGFATADATCPSGRAQSGGFESPTKAPGFVEFGFITDSYRLNSRTWRARLWGKGGTGLTSFVDCAKAKAPASVKGSRKVEGDVDRAGVTSRGCGKGRRLVAGGFVQRDAASASLFVGVYESFGASGAAWRTAATHSGVAATTLESVAYCAKKPG